MWPFDSAKKRRNKPPAILREWKNDIPGGELYGVLIYNNKTVCSTSGRYAHSSGSISATWHEFISGKLDDIVTKTMGIEVLQEIKMYVTGQGGE